MPKPKKAKVAAAQPSLIAADSNIWSEADVEQQEAEDTQVLAEQAKQAEAMEWVTYYWEWYDKVYATEG